MATLKKMTRMGADVRQIARLLQAKAPEGHMLAYITPEEAELLKSQGGSGKPHADTGVPSFEQDGSYGFSSADITPDYDIGNVRAEAPPPPTIASPPEFSAAQPAASFDASTFAPPPSARTAEAAPAVSATRGLPQFSETYGTSYGPGYAAPTSTGIDTSSPLSLTLGDRFRDLAKGLGVEEATLGKLGAGGIQALLGARTASKAAKQGQAGKAEIQALAQPYQAKGAELQRAAQAGELTPQSQQALQAVQAQAAQQATSRGGVGAMQSQAQVEAFRQQLLAQQYDYGLKLSGIGDNIALGAIKTGLQADQYVQQISSNYMNNIMRTLYGAAPQVAGTPAQPTPQG
jgi:hypothetical protein